MRAETYRYLVVPEFACYVVVRSDDHPGIYTTRSLNVARFIAWLLNRLRSWEV